MIVAIDGPAGSGKTTVARLLADKLGINYLDTGATYRALTLKVLEDELNLEDEEALYSIARGINVHLEGNRVFLDGRDVTESIRTPVVDRNISRIVSYPKVREAMVELQRRIVSGKDYVVEGRDIGTVVFPAAEYKFYLDARVEERAKRRFIELKNKGIRASADEVLEQMKRRDEADLTRKVGPLKRAPDAVYVDTTHRSIDEVVSLLADMVKSAAKRDSKYG